MVKIISTGGRKYTWWVGTDSQVPFSEIPYIDQVIADGDELSYIIGNAANLPYSKAPVQIWVGSLAAFIVGNIIGYLKEK